LHRAGILPAEEEQGQDALATQEQGQDGLATAGLSADLAGKIGEHPPALLVVLEHVVARAGGTEQNHVSRDSQPVGQLDRLRQ
jgi:hypothetical protein